MQTVSAARLFLENDLLAGLRRRISSVDAFLAAARWSSLASLLASALNVASVMLVARLLSRESFGHYVIIQSTVIALGGVFTSGIATALTRTSAQVSSEDVQRLRPIVRRAEFVVCIVAVAASLILLSSGPWLSTTLFRHPELQVPLLISAATVTFVGLDALYKGALVGIGRVRDLAIATAAAIAISLPLLAIATSRHGLLGACAIAALAAAIQMCASRYLLKRALGRSASLNVNVRRELSELVRLAVPATLAAASVAPSQWLVQAFLARSEHGFSEVAILGVAMQWFNAIILLPSSMSRVVLPFVTEQLTSDIRDAQKFVAFAMVANGLIALPAALILAAAAPWILALYGIDFREGAYAFWAALAVGVVVAVQFPLSSILWARAQAWLAALGNILWAALFVGAGHLLVPLGAEGVFLAMALAYSVYLPILVAFTLRQPATSRNWAS